MHICHKAIVIFNLEPETHTLQLFCSITQNAMPAFIAIMLFLYSNDIYLQTSLHTHECVCTHTHPPTHTFIVSIWHSFFLPSFLPSFAGGYGLSVQWSDRFSQAGQKCHSNSERVSQGYSVCVPYTQCVCVCTYNCIVSLLQPLQRESHWFCFHSDDRRNIFYHVIGK